ncbi:exocyst complex component exo70 subunit [Lactarius hengduanensis]|nr:exocyst complex component exo70 subunit [Lactarius hengduanensis]
MDDETAEIELVRLSSVPSAILTSFDSRLVKLEKTILPLYTSTQILTKRGNNIDSALQKIDEVASKPGGIAAEEALILRGPQPDQLDVYTDALERLNASIAFGSAEESQRDTARLVETGAKKLAQLFTKLVASGSTGSHPAGSDFQYSPFPRDDLANLLPLVKFLRALPLPATHPSPPCRFRHLVGSQRSATRLRRDERKLGEEVLGGLWTARYRPSRNDRWGRIWARLGKWTGELLDVVEKEYDLLVQLAPLPALIKRSLHKYTFHALACYSALSARQDRWDELITRRAERKENELKEDLHALRGVCLRSFPEFLADIKLAGLGRGGELLEVRDAVGPTLMLLGDGNWRMGDGIQAKPNQGKPAPGSEGRLIEHYAYDVVTTLITSLTTLSRMQRRPAFGSVFLLNNTAYLCANLLEPRAPARQILSRPTLDAINSNFRTAKAGYFDSNFSPLVQVLAEDKEKSGGAGKTAAKEKFTRFFDLLEEIKERHQLARVLEDDEEQRALLEDEVVKLVVPSLQRFTQKMREKEFSKNIKMTPEEVEAQIRSFLLTRSV